MLMKPMRSNRFMWMGFSSRVSGSGSLMCCGRGGLKLMRVVFYFFLNKILWTLYLI